MEWELGINRIGAADTPLYIKINGYRYCVTEQSNTLLMQSGYITIA